MKDNLVKQNIVTRICSMIAVGLVGLIFIILSSASILQTCRIDPAYPANEIINFDSDFFLVNLALIILTLLAGIGLIRKRVSMAKVDTGFMIFIMLIVTTVLSLTWVNLTRSVATGDESLLLNTAKDAAKGMYTNFQQSYEFYGYRSYFLYYPEKLGFVFFAEILYRIFGAECSELLIQIPNVIALDLIYVGVVMIAKRLFKDSSVPNLTALALIACFQPMFMTTFTQSVLLSLALSVWGVYFIIRYMQQDKLLHAGLSILLTALGCVLRASGLIFAAAIIVALVIHTVDRRRLIALAAAALLLLCAVGLPKLVTLQYSSRSGAELNTHITAKMKVYSGISESNMAPGWYNGLDLITLRDANMDMDAGNSKAQAGIDARLEVLQNENRLFEFLQKKLYSQFNEPSFQSVWISQVKAHNLPEGETLSKFVDSVYTGGLSKLLGIWFNYYVMILYIGFAAGMIFLMIRRRTNSETIILPLTVLGGVIFHILFEAKSQYILPYLIIIIPFAMYGLCQLSRTLSRFTGWMYTDKAPDKTPEE